MDKTITFLIQRLSDLERKYQELEIKHEELETKHEELETKHEELEIKHKELFTEYEFHSHKVFIATNKDNHYTRSHNPSFGEPESIIYSED
jgi:hypothetical protein